jgi:hypothetical protein
MCERWWPARHRECPACGADTDRQTPDPKPPVRVVNLMDALRTSLDKLNAQSPSALSGVGARPAATEGDTNE